MRRWLFGARSAYGQLVLLVFLPIAILASVGAVLVFFEVSRAVKAEQDALAQAALIRYEPLVRPLLSKTEEVVDANLQDRINAIRLNGMTDAIYPNDPQKRSASRSFDDFLYRVYSDQHVKRIAVLDAQGNTLAMAGVDKDAAWGAFDKNADSVWRLQTDGGTAYGMPVYASKDGDLERFWLFVDMDNEPLIINYYRVLLALAITGLTTMLLLLLILNMYAKRWIAPIYEMRLHLQRVHADNLGRVFATKSDGEFYLLQKELNATFRRLKISFAKLKDHSAQTEKDLQEALDQMEMQNISIRKARDLAISSTEAKSAFLANVSHELRTPLNAIDGFTNLLARDGNLDGRQRLFVQTIQKSSAHLLALINDVLDFSKIEAGKLILDSRRFDLYATIYEVADMLSPLAMEKGLRTSVFFYFDAPESVIGDPLRVKQILTNLLSNAIKFTDKGGITIKAQRQGQGVQISIADTGCGIDDAIKDALFQSFSQGDLSVTRRFGGTGLGLVICKQLVELMQGEIGFYDNADAGKGAQGATFWFVLPCDLDDAPLVDVAIGSPNVLAWIGHRPSLDALKASLSSSGARLQSRGSLAQLLDCLSAKNDFDWVIADSFGQAGDVTALLRQIRRHYQGKLALFGYEVGLDNQALAHYGAFALHEPLDRRKLYALLTDSAQPPIKAAKWQGVRVLAVDDHAPNLMVLEAFLGELGVQMVSAHSGFEAIEAVTQSFEAIGAPEYAKKRVDLIFMDISMPVMSGLAAADAIGKIAAAHNAPKPPIVALSAYDRYEDSERLTKAGICDYIAKPIAFDGLAQTLQKWIGDPARQKTDVCPPSDADLALRSVFVGKVLVVDWQEAVVRAGGKIDLAQRLFWAFQNSLGDEKAALQDAWTRRALADLQKVAHRLLGAARYTGAVDLIDALGVFYAAIDQAERDAGKNAPFEKDALRKPFGQLLAALDRLAALPSDATRFDAQTIGESPKSC